MVPRTTVQCAVYRGSSKARRLIDSGSVYERAINRRLTVYVASCQADECKPVDATCYSLVTALHCCWPV